MCKKKRRARRQLRRVPSHSLLLPFCPLPTPPKKLACSPQPASHRPLPPPPPPTASPHLPPATATSAHQVVCLLLLLELQPQQGHLRVCVRGALLQLLRTREAWWQRWHASRAAGQQLSGSVWPAAHMEGTHGTRGCTRSQRPPHAPARAHLQHGCALLMRGALLVQLGQLQGGRRGGEQGSGHAAEHCAPPRACTHTCTLTRAHTHARRPRPHARTRLLIVRWYTLFRRASSSSVCLDRPSWRRRSAFSSPSTCAVVGGVAVVAVAVVVVGGYSK